MVFITGRLWLLDLASFSQFQPNIQVQICCNTFLDMFAKLQKVTISLDVCVHMSVCKEQLGSYWMDFFMTFDTWGFFWKSYKKIQVWLKSDKNNR